MRRTICTLLLGLGLTIAGCERAERQVTPESTGGYAAPAVSVPIPHDGPPEKIMKSDEQWQSELTPEQYRVLRQKGTERAGSSELNNVKTPGTFVCAGCGQPLFDSETKYESGSGWPSFYQPVTKHAVEEHADNSHGMVRTEVVCSRCDGHLGHVFNDGPRPTGMRYCINGVSLKHVPKDESGDQSN
jgi:peptide-methionine (R)-S-oxide reductase